MFLAGLEVVPFRMLLRQPQATSCNSSCYRHGWRWKGGRWIRSGLVDVKLSEIEDRSDSVEVAPLRTDTISKKEGIRFPWEARERLLPG